MDLCDVLLEFVDVCVGCGLVEPVGREGRMEFGVWGLGFGVWGLGFGAYLMRRASPSLRAMAAASPKPNINY